MKKIWLVVFVMMLSVIAACNSGSDSDGNAEAVTPPKEEVTPSDQTDREIAIAAELGLPEEPDPVENNKTIEGIVGDNLIRDDVERKIAFTFYPDMTKINMMNAIAALDTQMIRAYDKRDDPAFRTAFQEFAREQGAIIDCLIFYYRLDGYGYSKFLSRISNNTDERLLHNLKRDALAPKVTTLPSYAETQEIYAKFKAE